MSLLDRLVDLGKSAATIDTQIKHLQGGLDELRIQVRSLSDGLQDVRERLARLEAAREADRAQMITEIERFKIEVERAELRLARQLPPSPERPQA